MKKRIITVIVAAAALLTLTASPAAAIPTFNSASGVLVRHDDGYIITGTLRDAEGQVVGTLHGTLTELTTGFTTCLATGTASFGCYFTPPGTPPNNCNVLGGTVTLNFQGTMYDSFVNGDAIGHTESGLCRDPDNPTSYQLGLFLWSTSHVTPGDFPDIFGVGGTVQQISPTVFKWSS
jgi:hypothetical protein